MTTVVSAPQMEGTFLRAIMPRPERAKAGGGRLYLFYTDAGGTRDWAATFDGEVIVESRQFATYPEALAWASCDARDRTLLARADFGTAS